MMFKLSNPSYNFNGFYPVQTKICLLVIFCIFFFVSSSLKGIARHWLELVSVKKMRLSDYHAQLSKSWQKLGSERKKGNMDTTTTQTLPEGALRKLHLHLCYHFKKVRIVALPFYLYNMRLEEYVAIK